MNTFGTFFRLTDFGESHGPAIGGVVDGMPSGFEVDLEAVQAMLDRRRPGQSANVSSRRESDTVRFLSGIFEGRTLGTPIGFVIANDDARSSDYEQLRHVFRPNHADYTYHVKYGHRDHRGGGRASARETAVRVVGGALASQVLASMGIVVSARTLSVHGATTAEAVEEEIRKARAGRDTVGGVVECRVDGLPAGIGEPVFGKLPGMLASAMMSINASRGFEYGDGFAAADRYGSEQADTFYTRADGTVGTVTNHSGGIQGGISNGEPVVFRVAFKPIATLPRRLDTVTDTGSAAVIDVGGRHDPCVIPRVLPVVEAMTAMTILDAIMADKARRV
ncbi:MAG: chorismate synthase [Muribaculaceae bacterium]|nr:chorismate synthase [Muribaculaceae bacterium]